MYYVCHTVHYIILRERLYAAVARTELTLFLRQVYLAQYIVVISNLLTDVIALFDFRGGVKGRENKKSRQQNLRSLVRRQTLMLKFRSHTRLQTMLLTGGVGRGGQEWVG